MKKRLTMLVVALMVLSTLWLIGAAAAAVIPEAAIGTAAAEATAMVIFGAIFTIGVGLFIAMSQKKGHTTRPRGSVKALNAAIIVALAVVNAKHTRMINTVGVPTSPKMMRRTCRTDFDTR
jgi:hypothetical protein